MSWTHFVDLIIIVITLQVYGETSFEMVDQLIEDVPFQAGSTFLDLGSGVGQVVLQVAASNVCRVCYGIEQAPTPCYYAKVSEKLSLGGTQYMLYIYCVYNRSRSQIMSHITSANLADFRPPSIS